MITFMNLDSSTLPNLGSGRISRFRDFATTWHFSPLLLQLAPLTAPRELKIRLSLTRPETWVTTFADCATQQQTPFKQTTESLFSLWAFRTVFGARLLAVFHALQIERTTNDVVTNTGQVLDTTPQPAPRCVPAGCGLHPDVRNHLKPIGQAHFGNFTQAEFGFFGVVVYTRVQTPRRCGEFSIAGLLDLITSTERP